MLRWLAVALAGLVLAGSARAQGFDPRQQNLDKTQNPAISFITDLRARTGDAVPGDVSFQLESIELGVQAYASPYARGDLYLGYHDGEIEAEEAFATFSALPADLSLQAGLYRVWLGRFNVQHPHQFAWLDSPLLVTEYLGEEGYADIGLDASLLLGIGSVPVTLRADVLDGARFGGHEHDHGGELAAAQEEEPPAGRKLDELGFNGRASAFFTLSETTFLELAGTAGTVTYDTEEGLRNTWFGGDFKFKFRPDRRTALEIAAEVVRHERDVEPDEGGGTVAPVGAFGYVDYRFDRRWNVGALVDYAQTVEDPDEAQLGLGGFAGFAMFEESTLLRLLVRRDEMPFDAGNEWNAQLQLIFSLGPHKPHTY